MKAVPSWETGSAADWETALRAAGQRPVALGALWSAHPSVAIDVALPGLGPLAAHPALLFKLRGALGACLMAGGCVGCNSPAPGRLACTCSPVCPAMLLFGTFDVARPNAPGELLAKPFVLTAWQKGRDLWLRLVLYGHAACCADAARLALVRACTEGMPWPLLAKDTGVTLLNARPVVERSSIIPVQLSNPDRFNDGARIEFVTGLEINTRAEPLAPSDIFDWTVSRIRGLAPWFGVALDERAVPALRDEWLGAVTDFALDADVVRVERLSSRSGEHWESARQGASISLEGPLSPQLCNLLVLGERTHVGRGAVNGLGRYRLSPI